MTGWGQDGPVRPGGRPRHQLHLAGRRARPLRPRRRGAGAAAQHGRRLRRRRDVPRLRRRVRAARGAAQRAGPGRRRGDGRRLGGADERCSGRSKRSACSTRTHRGTNLLDTGAHFYDVYQCADGEYISIGSIEPQFYAELLRLTGLDDDPEFAKQMDRSAWPHLKAAPRRGVRDEDARRVVRADGGHRRLLRPGADDERGRRAPAQRRARHVRRDRRRAAAGAGAALLADHARGRACRPPIRASTPRRSCATGASTPPELTR